MTMICLRLAWYFKKLLRSIQTTRMLIGYYGRSNKSYSRLLSYFGAGSRRWLQQWRLPPWSPCSVEMPY